ncbi:MAG: hypothetical protein U9R27_00935 [Campylobacterota bacterium]|nr:hypothetical protein [Campylobacterota bacterium]
MALIVIFTGCAETQISKEDSALIVWKTPTFRYADLGFISDSGRELNVEIYGSGSALMRLKIDQDMICMSRLKCMSKEQFNREVLSHYYPKDIVKNIFRGRVIFGGRGYTKNTKGFSQNIISKGKYEIEYKVVDKEIIFRDRFNTILIKVKNMG